ncbi:MAG: glutaminyl-peptide cyclotransferase [Candidatus Omnitrophota bacterium]
MKTKLTLILAVLILSFQCHTFAEERAVKKAKKYDAKIPVRIIKEVPLPKGYHEGLYYDGKNMWVCNGEKGNIWVVNPDTGKVLSEIEPVGSFTEGITAADNGTFWVTDWEEKMIYRVKIGEGKMSVEYEIDLSPAHPAGVVWTGDRLYMITWTRGLGTKYHLMQLNKNERMFRKMLIKRIHEPAHLAWDGKNLWITSWYNQLVYKVDVETFEIVGSFRAPVRDVTGIVWDGEYFWLTGTRSNLYQLKVGE